MPVAQTIDEDPRLTARPADGLLHAVVLVALAALVLNDQLLKAVPAPVAPPPRGRPSPSPILAA